MGIYFNKGIYATNNIQNYSSNSKYNPLEQKVEQKNDDNYHITTYYFLKYTSDPNTSHKMSKLLLNNFVSKDPTLSLAALRLMNKSIKPISNEVASQNTVQDLHEDHINALRLKRAAIKETQARTMEKLRALKQKIHTLNEAADQNTTTLRENRQQISLLSKKANSSISAYPSPVSTDDERVAECA